MLELLKNKIANHLLDAEMVNVYGNKNAIRDEKRSRIDAILIGLWPDLQAAVQAEVSAVQNLVKVAERECVLAADEAKTATGITFRATQTLLASLDAVHDAEARIVDSQNAVIRAEANLANAKLEFSTLLERTK
jgi:hypothetical protein